MILCKGIYKEVIEFAESYFPVVRERGGWTTVYECFYVVSDKDGSIVAALILTDYNAHEIDLTLVSQRPGVITPNMCREVFRWIFGQGFKRINARVARANSTSRKVTLGMGFKHEGTLKYGWDNGTDDMCIYGMTFDDCKWLENEITKTTRPTSNSGSPRSREPGCGSSSQHCQ